MGIPVLPVKRQAQRNQELSSGHSVVEPIALTNFGGLTPEPKVLPLASGEANSDARRGQAGHVAEWTESMSLFPSARPGRPIQGRLVRASSFLREAGNLDFYVKLLYF